MLYFCTLFDSFYLDKGLVLYQSLIDTKDDFTLFIFAFDNECLTVLRDLKLENAVIISLDDFENEALLGVKPARSKAEYCWTCTPWTIRYVFDHYQVNQCTYIDADLYFFQSPWVLLDEMNEKNSSVQIVEHRFEKNTKYEALVSEYGKYCVQFNTFRNDENGNKVLNWWKDRCLEWCYYTKSGELLGDQKYLDRWTIDFQGVHELQHLGGGVAPWNLAQYKLASSNMKDIKLTDKNTGKSFDLIFYHFQNMRYINQNWINIKSGTTDRRIKETIYIPYLRNIEKIRTFLRDTYHLDFNQHKTTSNNRIISFVQRHIMQFKCRSISDIINLKIIVR